MLTRYEVGVTAWSPSSKDDIQYNPTPTGEVVFWEDILPLLREVKEVNQYLRSYRLHSNPAIRSELIDKALEKLQGMLAATAAIEEEKGVEG